MITRYISKYDLCRKMYLFLSLFMFSAALFAQADITYPIEVFRERDAGGGWNEASVAIDITIAGLDPAGTEYLYLKVNNLNDGNRMQYRVRPDGSSYTSWQTAAPNQDLFPKDAAYGGLGGGFGTNQFVTPVSGFGADGDYQIQFRYEHELITNEFSEESGYRILEMELWEANSSGQANLFDNGRTDEVPALWEGPFGASNTSKANAGKDLWEGSKPLIDASGAVITATCADCHVTNGYDLKYFNYSNKSIQARANFHGLTYEEGREIAQYIRDLTTYQSTNGRPWNPPFQPGPNADVNTDEWAAGQGLWDEFNDEPNVLDSDSDMIEELFGNSNPNEDIMRTTLNNFSDNTNIRTQKVSVQFPDWNEWLPTVHPKDLRATGGIGMTSSYAGGINGVISYDDWDNINSVFTASSNPSPGLATTSNGCRCDNFNALFGVINRFIEEPSKVIWGGVFPSVSYAQSSSSNNIPFETKKRSLGAYTSVKTFELVHLNGLHDITNYQGQSGPIDDIEVQQWPTRHWAVFQNAAHVSSSERGNSYWWADDDGNNASLNSAEMKGIYMSSIWYQVQLTLTPGHRTGSSVEPNDHAYNLSHVNKLSNASGIMEPARFLQNYLKAAEQRTNDFNVAGSNTGGYAGWNMRELSPWRLYGSNEFPNGEETKLFDELGATLARKVRNVFIEEVTERLEFLSDNDKWGPKITLEWSRTRGSNSSEKYMKLEEPIAEPESALNPDGSVDFNFIFNRRQDFIQLSNGSIVSNPSIPDITGDKDAVEVDAAYSLLDFAKDGSVIDETVFNRFRDWADDMWNYDEWPIFEGATGGSGTWPPNNEVITSVGNGDLGLLFFGQSDIRLAAVTNDDNMKWTATEHATNGSYYINSDDGVSHPRLSINDPAVVASRLITFTGSRGQFDVVDEQPDGTFALQCRHNGTGNVFLSHEGGVLGVYDGDTPRSSERWRVGEGDGGGGEDPFATITSHTDGGTISTGSLPVVAIIGGGTTAVNFWYKLASATGPFDELRDGGSPDTSSPYESNLTPSFTEGTDYTLRAVAIHPGGTEYFDITVTGAAAPGGGGGDAWPTNGDSFTITSAADPGEGLKMTTSHDVDLVSITTDNDMLWTRDAHNGTYDYIINVEENRKLAMSSSPILVSRGSGSSVPRVRWIAEDAGDGKYYLLNNLDDEYLLNVGGNFATTSTEPTGNIDGMWIVTLSGAGARKANEVTQELVEAVELSIYPNPFTSQINIEGVFEDSRVVIYDIFGGLVFKGVGVSQVDLSDKKNGIYIIQVDDKQFKIIKD